MVKDEECLQTVAGMKGVGLEAQVGDTDAERDVEKVEASGAMRCGNDAAKCVGEAWEASMSGARRVAEVEDEIDNDKTRPSACLEIWNLRKSCNIRCWRILVVGFQQSAMSLMVNGRPNACLDAARG